MSHNTAQSTAQDSSTPPLPTDEDGEVLPPDTVGGYILQNDGVIQTTWAAPSRCGETQQSGLCITVQQSIYVIVKKDVLDGGYKVSLAEAHERPRDGDVTLFHEETKYDAVAKAVNWMESSPAPKEPDTLPLDERIRTIQMDDESIIEQAKAIRMGSKIEVGDLPIATVVDKLDPSEPDHPTTNGTIWLCETHSGSTFRVFVPKKTYRSRRTPPAYTRLTHAEDREQWYEISYLYTDNEDNLRPDVHTETYEFLKQHEGETVIQDGQNHTIHVVSLDELRDGAVNPPSGPVDPTNSRTTYIDDSHAGEWFTCPFDIDPGKYELTTRGLASDQFGGSIHVAPDVWDSHDVPGTTEAGHSVIPDLSIPTPADRPALNRHDPITEVTGVGTQTQEKTWSDNLGELYDIGFPLPYVSGHYVARAIADMYQIDGEPTVADAIRAVVGMLGGTAFDSNGGRLGTAASCIATTLSIEDADSAWLSRKSAIKAEYCPTWIDHPSQDGEIQLLGVGEIAPTDIEDYLTETTDTDAESLSRATCTQVVSSIRDDDLAVSAPDSTPVSLTERPLQIASTIALCDPLENPDHITYWPLDANDNDGILLVSNPNVNWSVVLNTSEDVPTNLQLLTEI